MTYVSEPSRTAIESAERSFRVANLETSNFMLQIGCPSAQDKNIQRALSLLKTELIDDVAGQVSGGQDTPDVCHLSACWQKAIGKKLQGWAREARGDRPFSSPLWSRNFARE